MQQAGDRVTVQRYAGVTGTTSSVSGAYVPRAAEAETGVARALADAVQAAAAAASERQDCASVGASMSPGPR